MIAFNAHCCIEFYEFVLCLCHFGEFNETSMRRYRKYKWSKITIFMVYIYIYNSSRIDFGIVLRVFSCFQNVYYSSRVTDVQRTLLLYYFENRLSMMYTDANVMNSRT